MKTTAAVLLVVLALQACSGRSGGVSVSAGGVSLSASTRAPWVPAPAPTVIVECGGSSGGVDAGAR